MDYRRASARVSSVPKRGGTIMRTITLILNLFLILIAVVGFTVGFIGGVAWLAAAMALITCLLSYSLVALLDN